MSNETRTSLRDWRIVIVDDDAANLEIVNTLFHRHGAATYTATNGINGFDKVKTIHPHFVITDLLMPLMDGWGLVDKLKDDPSTAMIPVIALTAYGMPGRREHAISAGFHYYLTKPINSLTFVQELLLILGDVPVLSEKATRATSEIKKVQTD